MSPVENLLKNSSFESSANWNTYLGDEYYTNATITSEESRIGKKSVKLSADHLSPVTYYQRYTPTKSGYYTYSVYYKTDGVYGTGEEGISALLGKVKHTGTKSFARSEVATNSTNGEWNRLVVTTYVDISVVREIHLTNGLHSADGTVYFDCAQLEYSPTVSDYNMLYNGYFNDSLVGWTTEVRVTGEGRKQIGATDMIFAANQPENADYAMVFYNSGKGTTRNVKQSVAINQPANKVVLNFSGYAHANAVKKEDSVEGIYFSLGIRFNFSDGTNELVTKAFNNYNWSWQHLTGLFTPSEENRTKTVNTVDAMFLYCHQGNFVEATGFKLVADTTGEMYAYDDMGNLISAVDTKENAVSTEYDEQNRLTKQTMEDGAVHTFDYGTSTTNRLVQSATAPKSQKTDYTYNSYGQTTKTESYNKTEENPQKIVTESTYSSNGKLLEVDTDAIGTTTTYTYDSYDRPIKVNPDSENDANYTESAYDNADRLISISSKRNSNSNSTVSVGYTYQNNMLSAITHNGFSYLFNYDLFGNNTKIMLGGRTLTTNTYTKKYSVSGGTELVASDLLTKTTYGNGDYLTYEYDKYGRVTKVRCNGVQKYDYTYDSAGNLAQLYDKDNNYTYTYQYDELGRLNHIYCTTVNLATTYRYDGSNRLTQKLYSYNKANVVTSYAYDAGGYINKATFNNGSERSYTYDSLARVGEVLTKTSKQAVAGWQTEYSYYSPSETRTSALVSGVNHKTLGLSLNYIYDKFGNIIAIKENNTLKVSYEYDNLGQLVRENNLYSNKTVIYNYDNGGNILSKTEYAYTTESLDGVTGTVIQYTYGDSEWKDLLTEYNGQSITYDEIGNPLSYRGMTFGWKMGAQLSTATTNGKSITYRYDESGIRTYKTVGGIATRYLLDGSDIIAQNGATGCFWYEYDANGQRHSMTYNGATYYYYYNAQGDVIGLYDANLNSVVQYTYDTWGKVLSITGSMASTLGQANPFRYRGYHYDAETGFYYVSSRYYDPEIGRWISPEPNVYNGEFDEGAGLLGYNVYAYCANNPVMFKDETGESITLACVLIGAGIGLLAGGGFGAYRASKKGYSPSDGWKYWKYVVGYGVAGGAVGALVGWGAGALIAKYGVATAATSITKGGGARFSSFNALKRSLGSAGKGKQWHHIVEQCQIGKSGFSKYWIQNSNNVINISNSVHSKVSAYYNSVHRFTNGMRFRDWLSGQSFKTQYEWGIKVLRMYGVKI